MELKTIDSGLGIVGTVLSTGNLFLLNGVASGTAYNERIGRTINIESLLVRVFFLPGTASSPTSDILRLMIIHDQQANGAAPSLSDILQTSDVTSPLNLNYRERFTVFTDRYIEPEAFSLTAGAITGGSPSTHIEEIYMDTDIQTVFNSTGAPIANIQTGSIYLLLLSISNSWTALYNSRVRFTDC